jgi:hypothetical protein
MTVDEQIRRILTLTTIDPANCITPDKYVPLKKTPHTRNDLNIDIGE